MLTVGVSTQGHSFLDQSSSGIYQDALDIFRQIVAVITGPLLDADKIIPFGWSAGAQMASCGLRPLSETFSHILNQAPGWASLSDMFVKCGTDGWLR